MAKKPYIKHTVPAATKAWLKKEAGVQKKLHKAIQKEMNVDLAEKRAQWYQEFFERCMTRGWNQHFTDRIVLTEDQIPTKPKGRKDKVVW